MLSLEALGQLAIAFLCYSTEYSSILALKITPGLFQESRALQLITKTALTYIASYHKPPGEYLEILLENELKQGTEGKLLYNVIQELKEKSKLDPAIVLDNLDVFIQNKTFANDLIEASSLIESGDREAAQRAARRQSSFAQQGTPGILLQDPKQSLSFLDRNEEYEWFSSGISVLDKRNVRPERKTITFMIAASGRGKSHWLVSVGVGGLQFHHAVLHITLELSEELTARRYIQSIFSLTKDQAEQIRVPCFIKDDAGTVIEIQTEEFLRESVVAKRKAIEKSLREMHYPPFRIKEFPTAAFSTEQLTMYLDSLEKEKNFKPDLLIIDYADLMKLDAQALRIDTGRLYRELRGIAVSRNIALVTATQGNRESETSKFVGSTNVAEDWSKIGTSDNVLTYSQTPQEYQLGLARIYVAKSRNAADRFMVLVTQNYRVCQFAIDSTPMTADLANQIQPNDDE
jgi:hypothetical protein